jgi:hypothetical protein
MFLEIEINRYDFIIGEVDNEIIKDNNQMASDRSAFWLFFVSSLNSYHIRVPSYQWTSKRHAINLVPEISQAFTVSMLPWALAFMILNAFIGLFWGKIRQADAEKSKIIADLPICAACKKIRDDKGYWNQIEAYISEHSAAEFSHGICPECVEKLYPDIYHDQ